jgi:GT2 family glycosyltransferase
MKISVSVVIPTYNRPARLHRCLLSVLGGVLPPARLVVCDQSEGEEIRRMLAGIEAGTTEVRYLHLDRPNASAARNAGWRSIDSTLVAFVDDDCVADSGWLAAGVAEYHRASAQERVIAVTGRVLPLFSAQRGIPVSTRAAVDRCVYRAREGGLERGAWAPWDAGTGGNLLVARDALRAIGGFDPLLGPGTPAGAAEDVDLLYRLARVGTIVYQPAAVIHHPTDSRRERLASRYGYGKGMGAMLAKHLSAGDPAARRLKGLYLRHQGMNSVRRGLWGPSETALSLAGFVVGLLHRRPNSFPALANGLRNGGTDEDSGQAESSDKEQIDHHG